MIRRCFFRIGVAGFSGLLPFAMATAQPVQRSDAFDATNYANVGGSSSIPDIVVTARRREETIQTVPISIIALDATDLEARTITNLADVQRHVPNLTLAPSQNVGDAAANIFIRGIGQEDFVAGADPGVGLYIDGIYIGRAVGALTELLDISRIEVLRGPQGTLYGRNAIGGAINVISSSIGPQNEGTIAVGVRSYGSFEAKAILNAPLSEQFRLRIAALYSDGDGFIVRSRPPFPSTPLVQRDFRKEGARNSQAARLTLQWQMSDRASATFSGDISRRRGTQSPTHLDAVDPTVANGNLGQINSLIRAGILPGPEILPAIVSADLLASQAGGGNSISQDIEGFSLTLKYASGEHELSFLSAYRHLASTVSTDLDGTYFNLVETDFDERHRQLSSELRLTGNFGTAQYVLGAFALHERAKLLPAGNGGQDILYFCNCFYSDANRPTPTFPQRNTTSTSYAAYSELNFPLARSFSVTAGGRFTVDEKSVRGNIILLDPISFQPGGVLATGRNEGSWSAFTWRAGLEFTPFRDMMAYASVATGFKSGGFNVRPIQTVTNLGLAPFAPETATTFEVGLRSRWLGDVVQFNATAFQTEYRDIQLRQQTRTGQEVTTLIENAARARIKGFELEVDAKLATGIAVGLAYGHLDATYLDVGRVPGITLESKFQRAPSHSLTLTFDAEHSLETGRLHLHFDYSYRSREQFQLVATPWDQPGYGLLGARATWRQNNGRWSVAVFGTNLTDERYRTAGRGSFLRQSGFAHSSVGMPRQIGLQITFNY